MPFFCLASSHRSPSASLWGQWQRWFTLSYQRFIFFYEAIRLFRLSQSINKSLTSLTSFNFIQPPLSTSFHFPLSEKAEASAKQRGWNSPRTLKVHPSSAFWNYAQKCSKKRRKNVNIHINPCSCSTNLSQFCYKFQKFYIFPVTISKYLHGPFLWNQY